MINRTMMFFLVLVLALSAWAFPSADEWQRFVSPDKSCSLLMPLPPEHSTQTNDVSSGKVITEMWMSKFENGVYVLGFTDYPVDIDPKHELDLDRDNFLKAVNAKLISESDVSVGGNAGREFIGASDKYNFKSRVFVVGHRRAYQIAAGIPADGGNPDLATKFVTSFEILKPERQR